jgi:hypothetical protein
MYIVFTTILLSDSTTSHCRRYVISQSYRRENHKYHKINLVCVGSFQLVFKERRGEPNFFAIAQAVSRWLPTAAARVRVRVWSCGICGGQSGAGAGFLRVLRFPLPIFIPPIAPQSTSSIIWGLYNRPEMAAVPCGLSPTSLIIINNNT